jgi:transcriptional regulator with XRE-family HTH domain
MKYKSKFFSGLDCEIDESSEDFLIIEIIDQIGDLRLRHGWTQAELAKKIGTTQSSIARLEAGWHLPSLAMLRRIAEACGTHLIAPRFAELDQPPVKIETRVKSPSKSSKAKRKSVNPSERSVVYADSKSGSASAE